MKKITLLFLMLLSLSLKAQEYKLGKVTVEELKEKVHPKDSSAVAAILFNRGRTYFEYKPDDGFNIVSEVEVKIKIYKKEGYEWANKEVAYFISKTEEETVYFNKSFTYNLVNGEIEKTKLKSDGEFTEKVNEFWKKKKIAMPNVKEGSIIEYSYMIKSPFFTSLMDWDFQKSIPVNYSEYQTQIPEYFVYNSQTKGTLPLIVDEKIKHREISGTVNEKLQPGQKTIQKSNYNLSFQEKTTTYSIKDVKALNDEAYINNIANYTSSIEYELSSIQYPNEAFKNYATDWETVVKTIYESEDFGNQLDKNNYFEEDLSALTNGITTDSEKTYTIFNFVKSRMSWNGFNSYYSNDGVKTAYKTKVGNVAEINFILIAMLRKAGIVANPIILSTQSNGIKNFPSRTAFNYVIAGVELDGKVILFDATDKNIVPNLLPKRALNWIGRIIRKDGTSALIDLSPKTLSKKTHTVMAELSNQGVLSGKVRQQYFDYNAYNYRNKYMGITKESSVERIEKNFPGMEVSELEIQNEQDLSKPILEGYSFTNSNAVEIIGDKIYFTPLLFFTMTDNPFKQETREYPIDFSYPNQDRFTMTIKIPDGYAVENMPKPAVMEMPDSIMGFKYSVSTTGQQVQILFVFDINQSIISQEDYGALKNFYKAMIEKQNEKVVLKKI